MSKRREAPQPTSSLIEVPDSDLDDLRARLHATRWAKPWPLDPWQAGTDSQELRRLADLWATGYDWRTHEAAINALPSSLADIGGTPVHYLRFDGEREGALPIVVTNGWPSSFLELVGLARRLAEPSRRGGKAQDAFTVIVPTLPGFAFSPQRPDLERQLPVHEVWHQLMHDELGFDRYAAHGSDLGAGVTGWLAQAHPESVVGIHLLDVDSSFHDDDDLSDEERAYLDAVAAWRDAEGAYAHQQRTRPLTLAQALSDSPTGLLAWIVEKHRAWSDCAGDVSTRFSDDYLLTQASLYWFTNTISTSFWPYYQRGHGLAPRLERVRVPTALASFPANIGPRAPESWVQRRYDLARYTVMPRGGHFAAHEGTELLADDITTFFHASA